MEPFPAHMKPNSSVPCMMFVDGENLVMRWQKGLGEQEKPPHVSHEEDVYVWSQYLNGRNQTKCNIIRRHYYTSAVGDDKKHERIFDDLQSRGIEEPHVFPRTRGRGSKQVDITLSVDMLFHAFQKNYDIAILIAGDGDYVPLVKAVKNTGRLVFLWFVTNGLSPTLKRSADYYFDISEILYNPHAHNVFGGL